VIYDTEKCGGCRTCELACSFHLKGVFGPSISSIKILDTEDELGFRISLAEQDDGKRIACDECNGLDEPFCVKYCRERDELRSILEKFDRSRNSK